MFSGIVCLLRAAGRLIKAIWCNNGNRIFKWKDDTRVDTQVILKHNGVRSSSSFPFFFLHKNNKASARDRLILMGFQFMQMWYIRFATVY